MRTNMKELFESKVIQIFNVNKSNNVVNLPF